MSEGRVLVAGLGKLGAALGGRLAAAGVEVTGIRRGAAPVPGVILHRADLLDPATLVTLPRQWDAAVYVVSASRFDEQAYRLAYVEGLTNLVNAIDTDDPAFRCLLFVSSTAVYGQDRGEWVDEDSVTEAAGFNGRVMLEAERRALAVGRATCVRFSGIYGPGRNRLLDQVRSGQVNPLEPVIYSNRIHSADCVGVLAFLLERALAGDSLPPVCLASDCEPAPLAEVQRWLAERLGMAPEELTEVPARRRAGSKRCSNRRLLEAGFRFTYPTYREGYAALLGESG